MAVQLHPLLPALLSVASLPEIRDLFRMPCHTDAIVSWHDQTASDRDLRSGHFDEAPAAFKTHRTAPLTCSTFHKHLNRDRIRNIRHMKTDQSLSDLAAPAGRRRAPVPGASTPPISPDDLHDLLSARCSSHGSMRMTSGICRNLFRAAHPGIGKRAHCSFGRCILYCLAPPAVSMSPAILRGSSRKPLFLLAAAVPSAWAVPPPPAFTVRIPPRGRREPPASGAPASCIYPAALPSGRTPPVLMLT